MYTRNRCHNHQRKHVNTHHGQPLGKTKLGVHCTLTLIILKALPNIVQLG